MCGKNCGKNCGCGKNYERKEKNDNHCHGACPVHHHYDHIGYNYFGPKRPDCYDINLNDYYGNGSKSKYVAHYSLEKIVN